MSQVGPTPAYTQSGDRDCTPPAGMLFSLLMSCPGQRGTPLTGPTRVEPHLSRLAATHTRSVQPGVHTYFWLRDSSSSPHPHTLAWTFAHCSCLS